MNIEQLKAFWLKIKKVVLIIGSIVATGLFILFVILNKGQKKEDFIDDVNNAKDRNDELKKESNALNAKINAEIEKTKKEIEDIKARQAERKEKAKKYIRD